MRSNSRFPSRPGSLSTSAADVRRIRCESSPSDLAAIAVLRAWLDCIPPAEKRESGGARPKHVARRARGSGLSIGWQLARAYCDDAVAVLADGVCEEELELADLTAGRWKTSTLRRRDISPVHWAHRRTSFLYHVEGACGARLVPRHLKAAEVVTLYIELDAGRKPRDAPPAERWQSQHGENAVCDFRIAQPLRIASQAQTSARWESKGCVGGRCCLPSAVFRSFWQGMRLVPNRTCARALVESRAHSGWRVAQEYRVPIAVACRPPDFVMTASQQPAFF